MLRSFGFNAFGQLGGDDDLSVKAQITSSGNAGHVALSTWEAVFRVNDAGNVTTLGLVPAALQRVLANWQRRARVCQLFGHLDIGIGMIDDASRCWWWSASSELPKRAKARHDDPDDRDQQDETCLGTGICMGGLCQGMNCLFLLDQNGHVYRCDLANVGRLVRVDMPLAYDLAVSPVHALFATKGPMPVYGIGSNRMGQLGTAVDQLQTTDVPVAIEFFAGLVFGNAKQVMVACGPFHSAVVVNHDLYTFGWNDRGRLGWHDDDDDEDEGEYIRLARFAPAGQEHASRDECPVAVTQIACGSHHTVILDDKGAVWTCGADDYGQLARDTPEVKDNAFHQTAWHADTIAVGPWSTHLYEKPDG
ncbi:regulator of chromosome condensation 1/beta-lactamase-inhibitor protein II [Gongronella butleri]|nr:regulator of chromosome condensation 1/beta-lactamase-inhibitor protein II [Gongronella butleri]